MDKIIEKELSYKLGGIFFEIQGELGRFCRERQYADLLEKKLEKAKIKFKREYPIEIANRKSNFVDFIVEDKILIDLKAKPFIKKEDYFQMKRYLGVTNIALGLIVNFQNQYLKPKRILNGNAQNKKFVDSDKFVASDRFKGFTMVELLIAMAIFVIVISIATGIFVQSLRSQRNIIGLMAINDNASSALEQMAREFRTGSLFSSLSPEELKFTNYLGQAVTYRWNSQNESLERGVGDDFKAITASDVKVRRANFILSGAESGDGLPTRVTAILSVGSGKRDLKDITTNLQTTVSARNLD